MRNRIARFFSIIKHSEFVSAIREKYYYNCFLQSFRTFSMRKIILTDKSDCIYRNDYLSVQNQELVNMCRNNDLNGIKEFYSSYDADKTYYDEYFEHRLSMRVIAKHIENTITRNSEILDIACGHGYVDRYLCNKGFNRITGIDLNENRVMELKSYLFDVQCADINSFESNTKYKVIIALEVFEHVSSIIETINKIGKLLEQGGIVYISTPNERRIEDESHVRLFSINTLANLMEQNGFEVKTAVLLPYLNHEKDNDIVCVCIKK